MFNKIFGKLSQSSFFVLMFALCSPLVITTFTKDNYILPKEVFITLLTVVSIFLVIPDWLKNNRLPSFSYPILFSFLGFLFFYALSSAKAINTYEVSRRLLFLVTGFWLYVAGHSINTKKRLVLFLNIVFLTAFVVSVIGILQYLDIRVLPAPFYAAKMWKYKAFSTLGNPQFLAALLVQVIPLVLVMVYVLEYNIIYFGGLLILGSALAATNTRSAWIVLFFVLCLMLLFFYLTKNQKLNLRDTLSKGKGYFFRKNFILIFTAVLFAAVFLFSFRYSALNSEIPKVSSQLQSLKEQKNVSVGGRIFIWKICAEIFKDYYQTGCGAGNFKVAYPIYKARKIKSMDFEKYPKNYFTRRQYAHNDYMEILAEGGLFSLIAFLALTVFMAYFFVVNLFKVSRTAKPLLIGIFSSQLGFLIMGLVFFPLALPACATLFFLNLGVLESYVFNSLNQGEKSFAVGKAKKIIYAEVIILSGIAMCFVAFKIIASDYYLKEGQEALKQKDVYTAVVSFEKGLKYAPDKGQLHYGLGYLEYLRGDYAKSLPNFLLSAYLLPERGVYYTIGRIFTLMGRNQDARNAYMSALKIDPHFGDAYLNLGILEAKDGLYKEAVRNFELAAKYGRSSLVMVSAFNNLSNCYFLLGDKEKGEIYKAKAARYLEIGRDELSKSKFVSIIK